MADIDQIIAGGAGASSRADFSKLGTLFDSYYKARDQAYQQEGRDLFKGGIPTTPDGQPDFAAMGKALFQHGDVGQGVSLSNLDLQRQSVKAGQTESARMNRMEGGGGDPASTPAPIVSPPSSNRNASAVVAKPLNRGGVDNSGSGQTPTLMSYIAASGVIPNNDLENVSGRIGAQLGVDPKAPINPNDPQFRNVVIPALQQFKRMGIGQVVQAGAPQSSPLPGQPGPVVAPAAPPQAAPQAAPNPQINQGTFGAPSALPTRGAVPTGTDPEIQKQIAIYTSIASRPDLPKSVQEAALTRLKALQEQGAPTGPIKEYDLYRRQGGTSNFQDFTAENEAKKTAATEEAKLSAAKYQSIIDNGTKAQQEIPQLQMLQEQMNDPNFFSGAGEKYNLLYKRLKSAVGIDPDAAVPQEFLRKATAANVLSSLGALKGLGQIRVAEINMAREAASSPDNSIPANKLLTEISIRSHQRNADIAELAQAYKEKNGSLDAGFDKLVTQYGKQHPMFTDAEIKDWGLALGRAAKGEKTATANAAPPMEGAKKAPDRNWYLPDPKRPGKYLKVVQ